MNKPTSYTAAEEREMLFRHLYESARYWVDTAKDPVTPGITDTEWNRMKGFIHTLLVTFDGGAGLRPAMDIHMSPHKSDRAYCLSKEKRWHKPNLLINNCQLRDEWNAWIRKQGEEP